jgi:hypothetical protein
MVLLLLRRVGTAEEIEYGRMMLDLAERAQWAEWRMRLGALGLAPRRGRSIAVQAPLVPPDANTGSGFEVELLENMLHVLLDGARTAVEDFADFVVTLSGHDPFDDLEFALGQVGRLSLGYTQTLRLAVTASIPGGHDGTLLPKIGGPVHTHNGVWGGNLFPDAELPQLRGDGAGPVVVRGGTGGAGMEDPAESEPDWGISLSNNLNSTLGREFADADEPFGFQDPDDREQMGVARREKRGALGRWKFIGSAVPAALFQKRKGAIVRDEVVTEEFLGGAETFREQSPEPFAAHFAALAIEPDDGTFRMFARRAIDRRLDAEPIANSSDLAERDAGLGHAKRTGIHPEE